jgi:hypothetical protein
MELIVFYLPGLHDDDEELLYGGLPAVRSLRSSLFRRTMGLILQGTTTFFHESIIHCPCIYVNGPGYRSWNSVYH